MSATAESVTKATSAASEGAAVVEVFTPRLTAEQAILRAAHSLSMPDGLITAVSAPDTAEPVLPFVEWVTSLRAVSRALYTCFTMLAVPTFIEQLRQRIHDYMSIYSFTGWEATTMVTGDIVALWAAGYGDYHAIILFCQEGTEISSANGLKWKQLATGESATVYRVMPVRGRRVIDVFVMREGFSAADRHTGSWSYWPANRALRYIARHIQQ